MVFNLEIGETKTVARSALRDWIDTGPEAVSFSLPRPQHFWTRFLRGLKNLLFLRVDELRANFWKVRCLNQWRSGHNMFKRLLGGA